MFNTIQRYKDYQKCRKVLNSCKTLTHYIVASSMIYQFGKKYRFNRQWTLLDIKCSDMI